MMSGCVGFLRLEDRGWVGRRGVNGAERKGLGFGVWGLTGGIRLLPARANQRLLGKGWSGMGRVKGVGGQAVKGVLIVMFVSMGWLREISVGGDGRGGGMAKDSGSMSEVPSRSRARSNIPSEDSGSLGDRVIRWSVVR